ncbi:MAG: DUF3343 domain-containing protein [Erysipelotrichaceae bacterium]|uniref:DUF3343 domain-containing protein n=1 Tax=Floccifex sp. TaxID=2815810 RepID=UPI002A764063|nr:DUF3343 domain-containing protein [Floccifex sp.]MDD7281372.1 DUF3343 domain-containing protein [Erysipelotrichaceae bacterium]MDY2958889.1 DUF3343 domain-containing protein [Floccifex sp.]
MNEVMIITFSSLNDALDVEAICDQGRLIPTPSIVRAGCGMCFMSEILDEAYWIDYFTKNHLKYENMKKVIF